MLIVHKRVGGESPAPTRTFASCVTARLSRVQVAAGLSYYLPVLPVPVSWVGKGNGTFQTAPPGTLRRAVSRGELYSYSSITLGEAASPMRHARLCASQRRLWLRIAHNCSARKEYKDAAG